MPPVTRTTLVADLLAACPAAAPAFASRGMACVGCSMARFETVAEAAAAYAVDPAALLADIARRCRRTESRSRRRRPARRSASARVRRPRGPSA